MRLLFTTGATFQFVHAYTHAVFSYAWHVEAIGIACRYGISGSAFVLLHARDGRRSSCNVQRTVLLCVLLDVAVVAATAFGFVHTGLWQTLTGLWTAVLMVATSQMPEPCVFQAAACVICTSAVAVSVSFEALACPYALALWPAMPLHVVVEMTVAFAIVSANLLLTRLDAWDRWCSCI